MQTSQRSWDSFFSFSFTISAWMLFTVEAQSIGTLAMYQENGCNYKCFGKRMFIPWSPAVAFPFVQTPTDSLSSHNAFNAHKHFSQSFSYCNTFLGEWCIFRKNSRGVSDFTVTVSSSNTIFIALMPKSILKSLVSLPWFPAGLKWVLHLGGTFALPGECNSETLEWR